MENELTPEWGKNADVRLLERWPRDGNGELEEPVFLSRLYSMDMGAELRINMLEAYGIPCLLRYPGDGSFGRVVLGMSGCGVDIYVPRSSYEDAQALSQEENIDEL